MNYAVTYDGNVLRVDTAVATRSTPALWVTASSRKGTVCVKLDRPKAENLASFLEAWLREQEAPATPEPKEERS